MSGLPEFDLSQEEIQTRFSTLQTRNDVAEILQVPLSFLTSVLYGTGPESFYREWRINKKSGGTREIAAPTSSVYILQWRLNLVLQAVYVPRRCVQGFVTGRGTVTNAWPHVGKRWVLNLDIEDFFPTLHFGRVRGVFTAKPFNCGSQAATTMAQVATFKGALPIGGPTSPVIANMIAMSLDGDLMRLAKRTSTFYTRYADDLTFSSNRPTFPPELATTDPVSGEAAIGADLRSILSSNGFSVNSKKTRLQGRDTRQVVTGIVVNERLNVDRRYIRNLRAMLHSVENLGWAGAQAKFETLDTKDRHPDASPAFAEALRGKLAYMSMVRGSGDPLVVRYRAQYDNLAAGRPRRAGLDELAPELDESDTPRVFLSYMREDKVAVDEVQKALESASLKVWRDAKDLWPGDLWKTKIRQAIEQESLGFVPCFSSQLGVRRKSFMYAELRIAADEYRQRSPDTPWIFPTFLEEVDPPSIYLGAGMTFGDLNWTNLYLDWDGEIERLVASLTSLLE